jgi:hypothetical protein
MGRTALGHLRECNFKILSPRSDNYFLMLVHSALSTLPFLCVFFQAALVGAYGHLERTYSLFAGGPIRVRHLTAHGCLEKEPSSRILEA